MHAHRTTTPGAPVEAYVGVQRVLTPREQGAGREWSLTLPAGAYWRLLVGSAAFTTAAAEANRVTGYEIEDGVRVIWRGVCGTTTRREATSRASYSAVGGPGGEQISGDPSTIEVPDFVIQDGFVVRSFTQNLQAADTYREIALLFDEIAHGPNGIEKVHHGLHVDIDREGK